MRLRNHTDIPTVRIREMVAFAKPSGVSGFDVRISNLDGKGVRGRAYSRGSSYHDRACPFVVISVQRGPHIAAWTPKVRTVHVVSRKDGVETHSMRKVSKGYLPMPAMSREEGVLFVIAHELRHLWQAKVKRGRRVWGARGQFSERDADAYALRALRHWRRGEAL